MACCEKLKYERLKVLQHAKVLACQEANLTYKHLAVVQLTHRYYGSYYQGIDYEKAKREGLKIFKEYKPGDTMAVQKGSGNRKRKVPTKDK